MERNTVNDLIDSSNTIHMFRSEEVLCDIAIKLIDQSNSEEISLFHGYSGDLLLIYELYNLFHKDYLLNYRDKLLEQINCNIEKCNSFNFRDGFSGLLYVYAYLDNCNFIETSSDLYDEFDDYFVKHINILTEVKDYDLLHGLIGFGIYYIERAKKQKVKRSFVNLIINSIVKISQIHKGIRYWENTSEIHPYAKLNEKWISFSFLHGIPSIISFFIICIKEGYGSDKLLNIVNETLVLFKYKDHLSTFSSDYSLILNKKGFRIHFDKQHELFYCNGELGFVNMYYKLGCILQNPQMNKKSESIYKRLHIFTQRDLSSFCVCHGQAGLLYFISEYECFFKDNLKPIKSKLILNILNYLKSNLNLSSGILEGYTGAMLSILSTFKKNSLGRLLLLD